jgi:hypothetical protein
MSPAYGAAGVERGGPMNASGQILSRLMIGNSPRLVKLTPAAGCDSACVVVSSLLIRGRFVEDPSEPGNCSPQGEAFNLVGVRVSVKDENGAPLAGVVVKGRFLDDYWTNKVVSGTTSAAGMVGFKNKGPCGVGAVAFLVGRRHAAATGFRPHDREGDGLRHPEVVDVSCLSISRLAVRLGNERGAMTCPAKDRKGDGNDWKRRANPDGRGPGRRRGRGRGRARTAGR